MKMTENDKIKEEDKKKYLESIFLLEEFISVEDYSSYNLAKNSMITGYNNSSSRIRLLFQNDENKSIEEFVNKKDMEKIYEPIRIYEPNKQNYINIFVLREENSIINGKTILNKINDKPFLKPTIYGKFKIKEFPLNNYSLEQINIEEKIKSYICLKKNEYDKGIRKKTHSQNNFYNGFTLCKVEEFITEENNNNRNDNNNKKLSCEAHKNSNIQTNYTNIPKNQMNPNLINNNMYSMNNRMINYNNNMNQNKNATNNNYMNPMFLNQNNMMNNNNNLNNNAKKEDNNKVSNDITIIGVCCLKGYEKEFSEIGLNNVGLTCYMNSTLQLLLHIPELNSFFVNIYPAQKNDLEKINKDADTRGRLSEEYCELVNRMMEKK